jgi:hypothetical protein
MGREFESLKIVLKLSDKTIDIAKKIIQRLPRSGTGISKKILALYLAAIETGEYIPLTFLTNSRGVTKIVRYIAKKSGIEIDLSSIKMIEYEVRGLFRVIGYPEEITELAVCVAKKLMENLMNRVNGIGISYKKIIAVSIYVVMFYACYGKFRGLGTPWRRLGFVWRTGSNTMWWRAKRYVEECGKSIC